MNRIMRNVFAVAVLLTLIIACGYAAAEDFVPLFPKDGVPEGWRVSLWSDVAKPPPPGAKWLVKDGVLHGSTPRGTWLVSEREYGDFALEFEFQIGPQGNSGIGLRFPSPGDPAFDGLEIQMADDRYYGSDEHGADQLTGSLYNAIAPAKQVYKAGEWNRFEITCLGPRVTVKLNGEVIQDVNLDEQTKTLERGKPLAERPRRGHIGFQELSRGGTHVQIRGARIKELGK
jgi:hypothetical protein